MIKKSFLVLMSLLLLSSSHTMAQGGGLDASFGTNGVKKQIFSFNHIGGITNPFKAFSDDSNRLTIVGSTSINGITNFFSTRWLAGGFTDQSYGNKGSFFIPRNAANANSFKLQQTQTDGKLILVGTAVTSALNDIIISRYLPNGNLDPSFGINGTTIVSVSALNDVPADIAVSADGKIIIAGTTANGAVGSDFFTICLLPSGTPDPTFNITGITQINIAGNDSARKVVVQPDGKIVVGGECSAQLNKDIALVRYLANGSLDTSFATIGSISYPIGTGDDLLTEIKLMPDGRLMAIVSAIISSNTSAAVQWDA